MVTDLGPRGGDSAPQHVEEGEHRHFWVMSPLTCSRGAMNCNRRSAGALRVIQGGYSVTQEFDRRSFLARGAVTASGLVVAGGSADLLMPALAGADQNNGKGLNGVSTAKPKRGGTLTIGLDAEEQGFNPASGRFDTAGFIYARTVYDPLMIINSKGQAVPYLAQSMTSNTDATEWTITMRPNIKFHDGTPCDGAALLTNIDTYYKSPLVGIAIRPLIKSYEQTGPLSIKITMNNGWQTFPITMAEQQICFVFAPSMLKLPNQGSDHPIGTGPFVFKEWKVNDHFTVVANKNYWRPGLPYLSQVTIKPIPDEQARAQALQSGTIQMMHTSDPTNIKSFHGNKKWAYTNNVGKMVGSPNVNCLMLNCAAAPFDDIEARRIVATGSSAAAYAKIIDQGIAAPSAGIYQPGSPYYGKTPYPAYSQSKAKSLAAAYAKKHGKPLSFTLNSVAAPTNLRQAQYAQQVMKGIGVTVTIKTIQQNELINNALSGSFQATEWSQFGGMSPDLNYVWFSPTTATKTGISINMARNIDPQIEAAFKTGMASTSAKTRTAAFKKVNERLGTDIPYVWLDRTVWALVSKSNVQNWANPKTPSGQQALGQDQGTFFVTQAWIS